MIYNTKKRKDGAYALQEKDRKILRVLRFRDTTCRSDHSLFQKRHRGCIPSLSEIPL